MTQGTHLRVHLVEYKYSDASSPDFRCPQVHYLRPKAVLQSRMSPVPAALRIKLTSSHVCVCASKNRHSLKPLIRTTKSQVSLQNVPRALFVPQL
jgi:hypothetical protein